jgi:hypothetical protein
MGQFDIMQTYRADNEFRFQCPIFGAEVQIKQCLQLRDACAKGKHPVVRQGCQACLKASKCPIPAIINSVNHNGPDTYFSKEPKVGTLRPDIFDRIGPIVVPQYVMNEYGAMSDQQKAMILAVNGLEGVKAFKVKRDKSELEQFDPDDDPRARIFGASERPAKLKVVKSDDKREDALLEAATTGDMSAAINIATQEKAA